MELANFLAELWGISIVIVSLALLIKDKYIKKLFSTIEEDEMFVWGFMATVIGVAMILGYNMWSGKWTVIITILGWLSLIKGVSMLFLPEMVKKWTKKIESFQYLSYAVIVMLFVGLVIAYLGFTA